MGIGSSRPNFRFNSQVGGTHSDENFFEVNFDELMMSSEFVSELLEKTGEQNDSTQTILSPALISDLMFDPIAFATLSNIDDIWTQVLAPMFAGYEHSKPFRNQLFLAMSRYFNERPKQYIDNEIGRQIRFEETTNSNRQCIMRHFNQFSQTLVPIDKSFVDSIINLESIKNSNLNDLLTKSFSSTSCITFNPHYSKLNSHFSIILKNLIEQNASQHDIETMIIYQLNWGFLTSDLALILNSLFTIYQNPNFVQIEHLPIEIYATLLSDYININNSVNFLTPTKVKTLNINENNPSYSIPTNHTSSFITCDGHNVYVISGKGKFTLISLSKKISNITTRFRNIEIPLDKKARTEMGIVASNNFLYLFGPFQSTPLIFAIPSFKKVDNIKLPNTIPRQPFTSDGVYIYSFDNQRKSILVHTIRSNNDLTELVLIKTIPIQLKNRTPIPKKEDFPIFTNGTVLTCLLYPYNNSTTMEYTLRHISLFDGHIIKDIQYIQKFEIMSITYDPWNHCYWSITSHDDQTQLVKMKATSAQPTWLYTNNLSLNLNNILNDFLHSKSSLNFCMNFYSYLNYVLHSLNGCSFESIESSLVTGLYSMSTTRFLTPCSNSFLYYILDQIDFYLQKNEKMILMTLFKLLDSNLMNFKYSPIDFDNSIIEKVVDIYYQIMKNGLDYLKGQACFSFANIYYLLPMSQKVQDLFALIYKCNIYDDPNTNNLLFRYIYIQIDNTKLLPYLIKDLNVRNTFSSTLNSLIQTNLTNIDRFDFMCSFMRNMMLELFNIYQKTQTDLSNTALNLRKTFIAFANLMYEKLVSFLQTQVDNFKDERFKFHPFVQFLTKWMILLEPFTQFSRLAIDFTATIQLFYQTLLQHLKTLIEKEKIESKPIFQGKKCYKCIIMIFYEFFSLYLNFLGVLIDGGSEMKKASQFMYLLEATKESQITPEILDQLTVSLVNEQTQKYLQRGFSFNIASEDYQKQTAIDFIKRLSQKVETKTIKALMDYFYSQGKRAQIMQNKKLKDEQRFIERMILSAFSKHLGVVSDIMQKNNTDNVKQIMESVYQIRRDLKLVQQKSTLYKESHPDTESENLEENYEKYKNEVVKKLVFLLHIRPCLEFQDLSKFSLILKHLTLFVAKPISVDEFYQIYLSSNKIRGNIKTGVQLISDFFRGDNTFFIQSFMIDKLAKNDEFINYLSNLDNASLEKGIKQIQHILNCLSNLLKENESVDSNSLIILYTNLVISISKIDFNFVYDPLLKLFSSLKDSSYTCIMVAFIFVLVYKIPKFAQNEKFNKIFENFLIGKNCEEIPMARIVTKIQPNIKVDFNELFDLVKKAKPIYYHSICAYMFEIIDVNQIDKVLIEIGKIASGSKSIAMSDYGAFEYESKLNEFDLVRSPEMIISFGNELIQLIRKILVCEDERKTYLTKLFDTILTKYLNNQKSIDDIDQLDDEFSQKFTIYQFNTLIFAVFAVLSNQIDTIHNNSLITDNNSTFYIDSIDSRNSTLKLYKLPISKSSQPIQSKLTSLFRPISSMPFTPSMYTNYSLLIEIFIDCLKNKSVKNHYLLILNSFNEYIKNPDFLNAFFEYVNKNHVEFIIDDFLYTNNSDIYLNLLKSHLYYSQNGFLKSTISPSPEFTFISPYSYTFKELQSTFDKKTKTNFLTCNLNKFHMFITNPLSNSMDTEFQFELTSEKLFIFGFYEYSTLESDNQFSLYSIQNCKPPNKISLIYRPNKSNENHESTYALNDKPFDSKIFVDKQIGFIFMSEHSYQIKYKFSNQFSNNEHSFNIKQAPLMGQTIFRKQNKNKFNIFQLTAMANDNQNTPNDLTNITDDGKINLTCDLKSKLVVNGLCKFDAKQFLNKSPQLNEVFKYNSVDPGKSNSKLIEYPNSPEFTSYALDIHPNQNASLDQIVLKKPDNDFIETNSFPDILDIYSYKTSDSNLMHFSPLPENSPYICPFTGEFITSHSTHEKILSFPLITSRQYDILPGFLTNLYTTAYINTMRIESLTQIMVNLITIQNASIDSVLNLFFKDFDLLNKLVQICIRIFVLLEPLNFLNKETCPIDFSFNLLENPVKNTQYFNYYQLIQCILRFATENDQRLNLFFKEYFNVLNNQFNDLYSHSCQFPHPTAYRLSKLVHSNFKVNRNCSKVLILKIGFSMIITKNLIFFKETAVDTHDEQFAVIPYSPNHGEYFFGTFVELALSFKYFCYLLTKHSNLISNQKLYRTSITQKVFDSINFQSPFFYLYTSQIFKFMNDYLTIASNDIEGEFIRAINRLALCNELNNKAIQSYLTDIEILYQERVLISLKSFFPQFLSNSDKLQLEENKISSKFTNPGNLLPNHLTSNLQYSAFISNLKRIIKFDSSKEYAGFPFHFFITDWIKLVSFSPPFSFRQIDLDTIEITFLSIIPKTFSIRFKLLTTLHTLSDYSFEYSIDLKNWTSLFDSKFYPTCQNQKIYLRSKNSKIQQDSTFSYLNFLIVSDEKIDDNSFLDYKEFFVNDLISLILNANLVNSRIFELINQTTIKPDLNIDLTESPIQYLKDQSILLANEILPFHLLMIRYKIVLIINYLYKLKLIEKEFLYLISPKLKLALFADIIKEKSKDDDDRPNLRIDRKSAGYIRLGMSQDLSKTIIAQMSKDYFKRIDDFRIQSNRPWHVVFLHEEGIDAGGLARELANEIAQDFTDPLCGLCIKTPDSLVNDKINEVIPFPDSSISDYLERYKFAGASIAISIRTGLVQHYNFPSFIWKYLISGEFDDGIEAIYSIDKNYQKLISELSNDCSKCNQKFVILNCNGQEIPLTTRGKQETVTLQNVDEFISLANDYRLNELKPYLNAMKEGLWENFNFGVPDFLDWQTLEYAACGDKEISVSALKKITNFSSSIDKEQIEIFWRVVEAFTPLQRSLLLKFATSSVNIPPNGHFELEIDSSGSRDSLPTASTCFNQLHYPGYSSYQSAYKKIKIAIECTDSFEKS